MATPGQTMAAGARFGMPQMQSGGSSPILGALGALGINTQQMGMPAGMNPKQLGDTLRLAQQFKNYNKAPAGAKAPQTWDQYMAEPRNQINIVMDQFDFFNRQLRDRGESEVSLFEFLQQAGVRGDIINAIASVYGGGADAVYAQGQ